MRLIDADALITELQKDEERFDKEAEDAQNDPSYIECYSDAMWSRANGIRDAIIEVYDAPTIDAVEVVHGEWICHEGKWIDFDYYPTKYECSQCHHYIDVASDKNFCPNCGASMREREGE